MSGWEWLGALLAAALLVYLFAMLLFAEGLS